MADSTQTLWFETESVEYDPPAGKKSALVGQRGDVPTELVLLFRLARFVVENIWGAPLATGDIVSLNSTRWK